MRVSERAREIGIRMHKQEQKYANGTLFLGFLEEADLAVFHSFQETGATYFTPGIKLITRINFAINLHSITKNSTTKYKTSAASVNNFNAVTLSNHI